MNQILNMAKADPDEIFNAIRIDRATSWGNPYIIGVDGHRDKVCDLYLNWLNRWIVYKEEVKMQVGIRIYCNRTVIENLYMLKGKHLACWCAPLRCHGDTLLKLANEGE